MAFSPDGRVLASVDSAGAAQLWNVANSAAAKPLGRLPTARNQQVTSVVYSPDGRTVAGLEFNGQAGNAQLWSVANPAAPEPLGHPLTSIDHSDINSIAFSPDGRALAIGNINGGIQLWEIGNLTHLQPGPQILRDNENGPSIDAMAFSPDGHILASADSNGLIQLWNVIRTPVAQVPLGSAGPLTTTGAIQSQALMYSGNGHMLVLLTGQGTVELWNVADPANPKRLRQLPTITTGLVNSVAFSPQGTLATDDEDGAIQLWTAANPANPQPFGQPIAISSLITSVTFRLDGTMAGGTSAGTIFLWDLHVNDAIKRICSTARGDLTARNWHQYIPQLPYQAPCR